MGGCSVIVMGGLVSRFPLSGNATSSTRHVVGNAVLHEKSALALRSVRIHSPTPAALRVFPVTQTAICTTYLPLCLRGLHVNPSPEVTNMWLVDLVIGNILTYYT